MRRWNFYLIVLTHFPNSSLVLNFAFPTFTMYMNYRARREYIYIYNRPGNFPFLSYHLLVILCRYMYYVR